MSKKFFSLLKNDNVEIAPGERILSKESYQQLMTAEELIEEAKKQREAYAAEAAHEAEVLKEKSEEAGFQEGLAAWAEKISQLEEEIAKVREDLTAQIIPVALKAAKKILGMELEERPEAVVDIVMNTLKSVAHYKKVKIYVCKDDIVHLEKEKAKVKALFEQIESLNFIESEDVKAGGCIIETEGGIINAQLENLIRVLESAFESYVKESGEPVHD